MGALMDAVMFRADASANAEAEVRASIARIAPHCAWTGGVWESIGFKWNEIQATPQAQLESLQNLPPNRQFLELSKIAGLQQFAAMRGVLPPRTRAAR